MSWYISSSSFQLYMLNAYHHNIYEYTLSMPKMSAKSGPNIA